MIVLYCMSLYIVLPCCISVLDTTVMVSWLVIATEDGYPLATASPVIVLTMLLLHVRYQPSPSMY